MTAIDFYILLVDNILLYIISLIIVGSLYYALIKNIVKSILDPIFIQLVAAAFANTIPLFLFFCGVISYKYIFYLICIESIFWIGYFTFSKKNISFNEYEICETKASFEIYKIMLALCIPSYLLTYIFLGIPILKDTYTETFSGGGGWGLLEHFQKFSSFFVITYSYYLLGIKKNRLLAKISMSLMIIFCLLSGSKSAILIFAYTYFFYLYYYQHRSFNFKKYKKLILLVCLFPLIIIMTHSQSGLSNSSLLLIQRVVGYGDMYWMALPNNIMEEVTINNPYTYLFQGILGPLRLIDYSSFDANLGIQLKDIVYPDLDVQFAPNSRLALLGWISFGWGGLILSFILGSTFAFIRTRLSSLLPNGIIPVIIYGYIYSQFISVLTDPILAIGKFFSIMIFLIILWFTLYLFYGKTIKLKKIKQVIT